VQMSKVERLLSRKKVRELISLSLAQMDRLEKVGKFPKRIRLTDHPRGRCAYLESEILEWIIDRIVQRTSSQ